MCLLFRLKHRQCNYDLQIFHLFSLATQACCQRPMASEKKLAIYNRIYIFVITAIILRQF